MRLRLLTPIQALVWVMILLLWAMGLLTWAVLKMPTHKERQQIKQQQK